MRHAVLSSSLLVLATAFVGPPASAASWIHVEVLEDGKEGAKVRVDLPLAVVSTLGSWAARDATAATVEVGDAHLSVIQLRQAWTELKAAGDKDFLTIEDAEALVKISHRAGHVRVDVDGKGASRDTVRVDIPSAVVDALLSGEGDRLDVEAALAKLASHAAGEIVRVESDDAKVRVWID